jgi:hypothetical protein
MKTKTITTWKSLASIAEEFMISSWIFLGVEDAEYLLIPKIGRPGMRKNIEDSSDAGYSSDFESRCIKRFKRESRPHIGIEPASELDWLSIAQHHGLPTRLLDWSESSLVAAYFALEPGGFIKSSTIEKDASIYGFPCPRIVTTDEELCSSPDEVVAYFPQHLTPRITAQRGLFTYHKFPAKPYEPPDLIKWVVPSGLCFTLKVILNKCGFNAASMFPDLGGIAKHVEWLHKWSQL